MKKVFFCGLIAIGLGVCTNVYGQKNGNDKIMNSTSIQEIEAFLATAHPEDPRRNLLKKKLIKIKNETWSKGYVRNSPQNVPKAYAKPIEENATTILLQNGLQPNKQVLVLIKNPEEVEFERLMSLTLKEHQQKTVAVLNSMFDTDKENAKEAIILVENNSDCNLIMRINGIEKYNLAVPSRAKNFIVVKKDNYTIQSSVCNVPYTSTKNLNKSVIIALSHKGPSASSAINTIAKPASKVTSN